MPQMDTTSLLDNGFMLFCTFTINGIYLWILPIYLLFSFIKASLRKIKNNSLLFFNIFRKINNIKSDFFFFLWTIKSNMWMDQINNE